MDHSVNHSDDAITRLSGSLTRWVLGWGLLSLHATVFTLTMIAMVLWNIYDTPNDIWVDEVFRRWGAVLAFHAIAVAAGLTALRLMGAEQDAISAETGWTGAPSPAIPRIEAFNPNSGWTAPTPAGRYAESMRKADAAFGRVVISAARLSAVLAGRALTILTSTFERIQSRRDQNDRSRSTVPDPTKTWPESPVRHSPEDEAFISRFAGNGAPPMVNPNLTSPPSGVDVVLDIDGVSTPDNRRITSPPAFAKEPGQSWVEAATYSWHIPHESQAPITRAPRNGHATPPPEMILPPAGD